jgi:hypothetical protein
MSDTLAIGRVAVRYPKDGRVSHGFLLMDDEETEAVLCFDAEADVPLTVRGLVEVCREEYYPTALGMLERCDEEGHLALFDGEPVDPAELTAALAETANDSATADAG